MNMCMCECDCVRDFLCFFLLQVFFTASKFFNILFFIFGGDCYTDAFYFNQKKTRKKTTSDADKTTTCLVFGFFYFYSILRKIIFKLYSFLSMPYNTVKFTFFFI